MKKKLTRAMAVILTVMMLIPAIATFAVRAAEITNTPANEIVNLYDSTTATKNAQPDTQYSGKTNGKTGELASKVFAVTQNQYIYVGPCTPPASYSKLDWIFAWYKKTLGSKESAPVQAETSKLAQNVVDTFDDGSVIYKIKVPKNVKYAALRALTTYFDYMLITIDQPFDKEGYFAYADAQGWDLVKAGLRTEPPKFAPEAPEGHEGLWNLFPREGERDPFLRQHNNNDYVMSDYIPVSANDVITIGAISTTESRSILYAYDAEFKEIKNYKRTDIGIDHNEPLGYSFASYKHTVPEGVAYIKICVHSGVYNDGDVLVTRNQPFTAAELRQTLGISELSDEAKAHPFYGKNALFIGDSISYGSFDTPPTYRNPSASWARRLALATGLIPNNISYPGASVGKTGLSNVKWEYDLLRTAIMSKKEYEMIVFHGGVNDARKDIEVGEALPIDTDRKILAADERVATFAGGLQLMFKDAKDRWPEAELYYVANFKLVSDSVMGKDMNEYFEQAKILCAEYGVHYIDLYNDVALYETFDYESDAVLPDLIHPTSASYDILFPTVLRLFNAAIPDDNENNNEGNNTETTPEETTPATPDEGSSDQNNTNEEPKKGLGSGAIIGIAVAAVAAVAAIGFAVYTFVFKKKGNNEKVSEKEENKVEESEPKKEEEK